MLKRIFHRMFVGAMNLNKRNVLSLLDKDQDARLLDLGCDEGTWTQQLAKQISTRNVYGLDIVDDRLDEARSKGIKVKKADLNQPLPYESSSFDCVHSNHVIEHLHDTDLFISEIFRVLKKGGYAVISTENLANWPDIFALVLGWQPFSATNISSLKLGIGNPIAIHRGEDVRLKSWLHIKVMSARALRELFEIHGFKVERVVGAGYFPLPAVLGKMDPRHSRFVTIKVRKT